MRLITYNLAQQDQTEVTSSSQNSNFPDSNVKHEFRSKEWRSNTTGNYVVDSSNNKINFSEGGSELTATITPGSYTSTTLATEIKTQLDAEGSETYTVSRSELTYKWTISATDDFELLNNSGTNQAVSTLKLVLGFANSDLTGEDEYTGATIALHTEEWVKFDFQTIEDVDSIALLWSKENGITLSDNAVVTVQANATDTWDTPAVSQALTINDDYEIASHYFSSAQSYRYWRIKVVDPANAYFYVNLGVIVIGKSETIQNLEHGFSFEIEDKSKTESTPYGHEYVDEYPSISIATINFAQLDYDETILLHQSYKRNGTRKPVFITLDHTSVVFNKDHLFIYGKYRDSMELNHRFANVFETELVIGEIS